MEHTVAMQTTLQQYVKCNLPSLQKGDPYQLLRINGSKCKLHLDPKTASTLGSMMSVSVAQVVSGHVMTVLCK